MYITQAMEDITPKQAKHEKKKRSRKYRPSVGDDLEVVEGDKVVTETTLEENKRRRTLLLQKENDSWGFTLQSYGIHNKKDQEVELLTYVDYVEFGGPGYFAGMRQGDVILSINGISMESADHGQLVDFIKSCQDSMRMVVLFEDCCRKVDLHLRYIKLKRVLAEKIFEIRSLEQQERRVMAGMSRFDSCRSSVASSTSSLNSAWDDRLSLRPELDRCPTPLVSPEERDNLNFDRSLSSFRRSPRLGYHKMNYSKIQQTDRLSVDRQILRSNYNRSSLPVGSRAGLENGATASVRQKYPDTLGVMPSSRSKSGSSSRSLGHGSPGSSPIHRRRWLSGNGKKKSPLSKHQSLPEDFTPEKSIEMNVFRFSLDQGNHDENESSDYGLEDIVLKGQRTPELQAIKSDEVLSFDTYGHNHLNTPVIVLTKAQSSPEMDGLEGACGITPPHDTKSGFPPKMTASTPEFSRSTPPLEPDISIFPPDFLQSLSLISDDDSSYSEELSPGEIFSSTSPNSEAESSVFFGVNTPPIHCSSPLSASDSAFKGSQTSTFSYSDLPQIELEFINEEDAVTRL